MLSTRNKKYQTESKYNRVFSEEYKRSKVKDLEKGLITKSELVKMLNISRTTLYKWIYLYSESEKGVKTVVQMESEAFKTKMLQERVAELERVVGQKQMLVDALEKGYELASEELGYDLKKKYVPRSWSGTVPTPNPTATK